MNIFFIYFLKNYSQLENLQLEFTIWKNKVQQKTKKLEQVATEIFTSETEKEETFWNVMSEKLQKPCC